MNLPAAKLNSRAINRTKEVSLERTIQAKAW